MREREREREGKIIKLHLNSLYSVSVVKIYKFRDLHMLVCNRSFMIFCNDWPEIRLASNRILQYIIGYISFELDRRCVLDLINILLQFFTKSLSKNKMKHLYIFSLPPPKFPPSLHLNSQIESKYLNRKIYWVTY
jgi:hypothetical protein